MVGAKENNPIVSKLCLAYPDAGAYILSLRQHPKDRIQWLTAAISSAREIGDRRGEGAALGNLGNAYAVLGDARKAIEFYEQHLGIAREIGDRRGEGNALFTIGLALYKLEEKERAIDPVKRALEIYEEIESPYAERARNKLKEWDA